MVSHGEFWTRNFAEYPCTPIPGSLSDSSAPSLSGAGVSFLSDALQTDVPQRYCLSPRACQGIINRAEKRGTSLPEPLGEVLRAVASLPSST